MTGADRNDFHSAPQGGVAGRLWELCVNGWQDLRLLFNAHMDKKFTGVMSAIDPETNDYRRDENGEVIQKPVVVDFAQVENSNDLE